MNPIFRVLILDLVKKLDYIGETPEQREERLIQEEVNKLEVRKEGVKGILITIAIVLVIYALCNI